MGFAQSIEPCFPVWRPPDRASRHPHRTHPPPLPTRASRVLGVPPRPASRRPPARHPASPACVHESLAYAGRHHFTPRVAVCIAPVTCLQLGSAPIGPCRQEISPNPILARLQRLFFASKYNSLRPVSHRVVHAIPRVYSPRAASWFLARSNLKFGIHLSLLRRSTQEPQTWAVLAS